MDKKRAFDPIPLGLAATQKAFPLRLRGMSLSTNRKKWCWTRDSRISSYYSYDWRSMSWTIIDLFATPAEEELLRRKYDGEVGHERC